MSEQQQQDSKTVDQPSAVASDVAASGAGTSGSDVIAGASDITTTASGVPPSSSAASVAQDSTVTQASDVPASAQLSPSNTEANSAATASDAAAQPSSATQSSPGSTAAATSHQSSPAGVSSGHKSHSSVGKSSSKTSPGATSGGTGHHHHQSSTTGAAAAAATTSKQQQRKPSGGGSAGRQRGAKLGQLKIDEAKIGIIGAGKMADALVQGLIHYGKIQANKIHVAAPSTKNLEVFKNYGCRVTRRNYDIFGRYDCDIIFLCFHGLVIRNCYKLGGGSRPHPLTTNYIPHQRHPIYILSMVSGVSLKEIKACLLNPESTNRYVYEIHRIMMNTAVGQGLGICAVDCEPDSRKLSAPLRQLLSSVSHLEHVPATQMDAACAIGGSGLAFSYYFINALADGAFKMGLSRKQAIRFASKTAQCAAQTMLESGKHPAELRDTVSAPSGAAIYGIHVLEKNDVASGVTAAVEAAHKRASELASQQT